MKYLKSVYPIRDINELSHFVDMHFFSCGFAFGEIVFYIWVVL